MNIKIITDSCCDLPLEILKDFEVAPMTIVIDGKNYLDGIDLTREEFYTKLSETSNPPGSAAPSPGSFLNKFGEDDKVFVITVSSSLSSSYKNAILARNYYYEKFKNKFVHVFDSLNASVGQGLIILKLKNLIEQNLSDNTAIEQLEDYINNLKTFFILENLDNLINSGRINKLLGKIVSALNIKFIMGKNDKGEIELFKKVRGSHRAVKKLIKMIGEYGADVEDKILGIAHCNCLDKANEFKKEVEKIYNFKDIIITKMGPTISTYADEGGLLISF